MGKLRQIASVALIALLLPATARAAPRTCQAEAKGAHNESAQASIHVADDGSIIDRSISWSPPSSGAGMFPLLVIDYAVVDGHPGEVNAVGVAAMLDVQHPPKSPYAAIGIQVDGASQWSAEWGMYHQNIGQLGSSKDIPPGARPVGFVGFIPMAYPAAFGRVGRNTSLFIAFETAHSVSVTIDGHAEGATNGDERIAENQFNLDDKGARDTLAAKALADALAAAKHPQSCKAQD